MREYGYLFLLVASSESRGRRMLSGCQRALQPMDRALVAHRYTTRLQPEIYEVALSEQEFAAREDFGCFLLDWTHRDIRFGLGVEVDRWLDGGLNVLALGHSSMLESARLRYRHHLRVVYAPGGKDPMAWMKRAQDQRRTRYRQLGLGFDTMANLEALMTEDEPVADGLQLPEDVGQAIQQMAAWMRASAPPARAVA